MILQRGIVHRGAPVEEGVSPAECIMNNLREKRNETLGITLFIVVAVWMLIATILYNSITEKRGDKLDNSAAVTASAASAVAAAAAAANAVANEGANRAKGASQ
ncbi:hypothetical protein VSR68_15555 [Paraburkholderia phymatum]|uniref:hypothetical protein n=1 Tax=Paraburkholderia phymatum TaxID=148447 RepID=UPI00316D4CFB